MIKLAVAIELGCTPKTVAHSADEDDSGPHDRAVQCLLAAGRLPWITRREEERTARWEGTECPLLGNKRTSREHGPNYASQPGPGIVANCVLYLVLDWRYLTAA